VDDAVRGAAAACEGHAADRHPFAPDHVGLCRLDHERFDCPLQMSQVEYLQSVYHQNRGTESGKTRSGCSSAVTAWTRT
jgi:hypothetical protein